jgi:uncharacterized membrane protein
MNIRLVDGQLIMHFLGVTTLTLVVGWSFCVLAGSAALVGFFLLKGLAWEAFPVSLLLTVLVPATLTRLLARLLYRPRTAAPVHLYPRRGFAGGGLVVLALPWISVSLFGLAGLDGWVAAALEWWPLVFLMMFSEGFHQRHVRIGAGDFLSGRDEDLRRSLLPRRKHLGRPMD